MEPIAPLSSSPVLGSSTSGAGGQFHQPQPTLQEGQTIRATVVEAAGENKFILDIGANRILAQSDSVTLRPGQSLQLQVTTASPQLELKIVAAPLQQYLGQALTFISQNLDLTPLIMSLQQPPNPIIDTLSPSSRLALEDFFSLQQQPLNGKEGGDILRQMLNSLGLYLEARLSRGEQDKGASLKSALLEVLHHFKESDKSGENGKTLLSTIESFQLSQLRLEQDKTLLLPLPYPFLDQGYLLIDQNQGQETGDQQEKKQLHFSLHLALTGLGNLQIEFLQTDDGLWIRFNCDSQEKADFVSNFGDDLKEQLADIPVQGLLFAATANAPDVDLIRRLIPTGQSLLNTKA